MSPQWRAFGLILALAGQIPAASEADPPSYLVISPKVALAKESGETTTMTWPGLSVSYYPRYEYGVGLGVHQMLGAPVLEGAVKGVLLNGGLSAGLLGGAQGVGWTASLFTSLVVFGVEWKHTRYQERSFFSTTFFLPLWWRRGKFWDVSGTLRESPLNDFRLTY